MYVGARKHSNGDAKTKEKGMIGPYGAASWRKGMALPLYVTGQLLRGISAYLPEPYAHLAARAVLRIR